LIIYLCSFNINDYTYNTKKRQGPVFQIKSHVTITRYSQPLCVNTCAGDLQSVQRTHQLQLSTCRQQQVTQSSSLTKSSYTLSRFSDTVWVSYRSYIYNYHQQTVIQSRMAIVLVDLNYYSDHFPVRSGSESDSE